MHWSRHLEDHLRTPRLESRWLQWHGSTDVVGQLNIGTIMATVVDYADMQEYTSAETDHVLDVIFALLDPEGLESVQNLVNVVNSPPHGQKQHTQPMVYEGSHSLAHYERLQQLGALSVGVQRVCRSGEGLPNRRIISDVGMGYKATPAQSIVTAWRPEPAAEQQLVVWNGANTDGCAWHTAMQGVTKTLVEFFGRGVLFPLAVANINWIQLARTPQRPLEKVLNMLARVEPRVRDIFTTIEALAVEGTIEQRQRISTNMNPWAQRSIWIYYAAFQPVNSATKTKTGRSVSLPVDPKPIERGNHVRSEVQPQHGGMIPVGP